MYLKRKLSESLITFKNFRFGKKKSINSSKRYEATVGVGGNVGDVKRRFEHLVVKFQRDKRVDLLQTSLILKNPPFGFMEQEDFFNSIFTMRVNMQPQVFLAYLMRIEKNFGRKRTFPNAPRTLDLDIIFFDNRDIRTKKLTVPHPEWFKRESVVIPLAGIR